MDFILQYMDLIWLPLTLAAVHKHQRGWAAGFCLSCMVMMRLQIELIYSTGFTSGFTGLVEMSVQARAQITYSFFYALYIVLAIFSPESKGPIMMVASISMFFAALFVSMLVMVL